MTEKGSTPRDFVSHWRLDPTGRDDELAVATVKYLSVARVARCRETMRASHDGEEDVMERILNDVDAVGSPGRRFSGAEQQYLRQRRLTRPQSASSARPSTSRRSDKPTPIQHGQRRPRSASASRRTSNQSSPPRKMRQFTQQLPDAVIQRSKWTDLLHTSPGFQDQNLQRLEEETYALLRHVLQKRPAACVQREKKKKPATTTRSLQKNKGESIERQGDTRVPSTSNDKDTRKSLAVGSGLQVVRKRNSEAAVDPPERGGQQIQTARKSTPCTGTGSASRVRMTRPTASSHARESQTMREKPAKRVDPTRIRSTKTTATMNHTTPTPLRDKEVAKRQRDAEARLKVMQEMGWLADVVELQTQTLQSQATKYAGERDTPPVKFKKIRKKTKMMMKTGQLGDTTLIVIDARQSGNEDDRLCGDEGNASGVTPVPLLEMPSKACHEETTPFSLNRGPVGLEESEPLEERDDSELESLLLQASEEWEAQCDRIQVDVSNVLTRITSDPNLNTVDDCAADAAAVKISSPSSRVTSLMLQCEFHHEPQAGVNNDRDSESRMCTPQTIQAVLEDIDPRGVAATASHGEERICCSQSASALLSGATPPDECDDRGRASSAQSDGDPLRFGIEAVTTVGENATTPLALTSVAFCEIEDVLANRTTVIEKEAAKSSPLEEDRGASELSSHAESIYAAGQEKKEDFFQHQVSIRAAESIQRSWELRRRCKQNEPLGFDRHPGFVDEHDVENRSNDGDVPSIQELGMATVVTTMSWISDPDPVDSHTTRKNDAARCLQRQYRRFVFRRGLLDQLSFLVRQHRRESRKKTRRLSAALAAPALVDLMAAELPNGVIRVEDPVTQPALGSEPSAGLESVVGKVTTVSEVVDTAERSVAESDKPASGDTERCAVALTPRSSESSFTVDNATAFAVEDQVVDGDDTIESPRLPEAGKPAPWERYMDTSADKSFYYNRERRVSQWDRPSEGAVIDKTVELPDQGLLKASEGETLADTGSDEAATLQTTLSKAVSLHEQWERYMDNETNRSFYFHPQRRLSQWERPGEESVVDRVKKTESQGHSISDTPRVGVATIAATDLSLWWSRVKAEATLVESYGGWDKYLAKVSAESFYYRADLNQYRLEADFGVPEEFALAKQELMRSSAVATGEDNNLIRWTLRRNCSLKSDTRGEWQAFMDPESHQTFYYNTRTSESTWEKPVAFQQPATEQQEANYLWVMYVDAKTSQSYYVNLQTNATSRERPMDFDQAASDQNLHRLRGITEQSDAVALGDEKERDGGDQNDYLISINDDCTPDEWLVV